jgi:MtaA/CmuA family methyltransferase
MLGLTETLLLICEQPNELKQTLEWRTQKAIEWADELINIGVECVWIGEGPASSSIISPETYTEFVLPYASRVVDHLKSNGVVTIMHVCGDIRESAGIIAQTGVNAMDIDYMVDLGKARMDIGLPICLRGNLNPVDLLNMSYDQLVEICTETIRSGGFPFVLSTGCLVARDTPPVNIEAMIAASVNYEMNLK